MEMSKVDKACVALDEKHMKMFIHLADINAESIGEKYLYWDTYQKGLNEEIRWLVSRGLIIQHETIVTLYRTRD